MPALAVPIGTWVAVYLAMMTNTNDSRMGAYEIYSNCMTSL